MWALFLPSVSKSLYFHRDDEAIKNNLPTLEKGASSSESLADSTVMQNYILQTKSKSLKEKYSDAFKILWKHFVSAYTNWHVIQWSLWYALAMCGFIQVQAYIQILWALIQPNTEVNLINYFIFK